MKNQFTEFKVSIRLFLFPLLLFGNMDYPLIEIKKKNTKKKNLFGDGLFFPSVFCLIETKQESVDKTPADEQSVWLGASSPFIHLLIYLF